MLQRVVKCDARECCSPYLKFLDENSKLLRSPVPLFWCFFFKSLTMICTDCESHMTTNTKGDEDMNKNCITFPTVSLTTGWYYLRGLIWAVSKCALCRLTDSRLSGRTVICDFWTFVVGISVPCKFSGCLLLPDKFGTRYLKHLSIISLIPYAVLNRFEIVIADVAVGIPLFCILQ